MKDNVTGKDKEFYERGKRMFDRLNPPGTPEFKPYFPKREWVGLTDEEINSWDLPVLPTLAEFARFLEAKIKEKNHD